ncbi:hypothetical protein PR048_023376 [Dryococelus australis]|uniref:Uncharacterized protein n=1 Tax=Dryococelus australis TaxID=614101 RepID=A0ABQ9GTZ6_9NEOP|nr:hypothetical protein PR048_023376 [Dryococelus australis]
MLQFAGLKTSDQMWLYGIHLTVQEAPSPSPPGRLIDFRNVSHMLERSGCKLSEKAERCQSFLEAYASSTDPLLPAEITGLVKTLETHYTTNGERGRSFTDLLSRFSSSSRLANNNLEAPQATEHCASTYKSPNDLGNIGTLSKALGSLKVYIDHRFVQSEKLLLTRVDEKFKELEARQSEKLELILQQLKVLNMPHNGTVI